MWPFDVLEDAVNYIIQMLPMLVALLLYFPMAAFEAVYNVVVIQLNIIIEFVNCFIDLYNLFIITVLTTFTNVWPSSVISYIIGLQVLIILVYRLYHFGKDVSIAGFKL